MLSLRTWWDQTPIRTGEQGRDDHCIPTSPHPMVLVKGIRGRKERMDATDWALDVNGWASLAWQKPAFHHQAEMWNKVLFFAPFSLTINHLTAAHKKTYKPFGELSCYSFTSKKIWGKVWTEKWRKSSVCYYKAGKIIQTHRVTVRIKKCDVNSCHQVRIW